jgi:hypothetical protein
MVIQDEIARARFRDASKDGRITCNKCMEIANELAIPTNEIASTLTDMHIKIVQCQLGCFP